MKHPAHRFALLIGALGLLVAAPGRAGGRDGWRSLRVPGYWEKEHGGILEQHDGVAWYRCFVAVPPAWSGRDLDLTLGRIDDRDEAFFNGVRVGETGIDRRRRDPSLSVRYYTVPSSQVRFGGYNLIALRVVDDGGAGGIGHGPLRLAASGEALRLDGGWQFRPGDDRGWAQWPFDPASPDAERLARSFLSTAGESFGMGVRPVTLPGTAALTLEGDIASHLVAGVDRFLLREIERSTERRARHWKRDFSSPENYSESVRPNRKRLARIIGAVDSRVAFEAPDLVGTTAQPSRVGRGTGFRAHAVRWPVIRDMHGEGLLLLPERGDPVANVVAIPDADQTPEMITGLAAGVEPASQFARRLAESGCRVLVPALIDRGVTHRRLSNREFLYRSAFELGRHLIGYEVQKVLAGIDWFARDAGREDTPTGVIGWGEGGLLALLAGSLDTRIGVTCVSGYFDSRQEVWREPIYRNVFGLLEQFGDAELASLIAPRALVVEAARGPEVVVPPGTGGAPGRLVTPDPGVVRAEVERARKLVEDLRPRPRVDLVLSGDGRGPPGSAAALEAMLRALSPEAGLARPGEAPENLRREFDPARRHRRLFHEIDRHNQWLLGESLSARQKFLARLDRSSLEKYGETVEWYREYFRKEVIGHFETPLLEPRVRTRRIFDEPDLTGYEVVMDVLEDVIACGILLLPRDLRPGERRPVVVCQHGLEGRPRLVADPSIQHRAYWQFAVQLTRRGFITFAPQNLYIFGDRFRTLQRKANPIGKTLFSVMVPQHRQITDWLASLPSVDPERIAFYGLSYGGKSAMRIPPLVERYCLSICSADFNEWVDKNASTRNRRSYVWTGEYEIFEFDLGSTFNYMEMAALIAPRPFMVERGHFDGVADDETVAYEFARVRHLYAAQLKIPDRCEIEWFVGPHTINGKGTFDFLHRHLNWPRRD